MLLRNRTPAIASQSGSTAEGFEHLSVKSVSLLRWLAVNRVEYVLVGPVAAAVRGDRSASGPVAIVPAPYGRNFSRLARALWSEHARLRIEGEADTTPVRVTADRLAGATRWKLRCGLHDLDIEGRTAATPSYQELLYEAGRFELAADLAVDVASPEDLEHYAQLQRTGKAPEFRISRSGGSGRAAQADPPRAQTSSDAPPGG